MSFHAAAVVTLKARAARLLHVRGTTYFDPSDDDLKLRRGT